MSRKIFAVALVFLCFAPVALMQASSTNGEPAPALSLSGHAARSLTPHDPIYIGGNDQFTEANGVSAGGNGSADNPYIIENWDISGASTVHGIGIEHTNAYFIIRNCTVHDAFPYYGIHLWLSSNGTIANCTIYNDDNGINLYTSSNNIITNCQIYGNYNGIWLYGSSNNIIANCSVYNSDPNDGIGVYFSSNNNIINCIIYNSSWFGIELDYSSNNNLIYHNNLNNTRNAYDKCTNYWHNSTLSEGNYWSDYTGVDEDGDGIGDDPYYISGGTNADNFPLMFPYPIRRNIAIPGYPKFENMATGIRISANVTNTEQMDLTNVTVNFSANKVLISSEKIDLVKNSTKTLMATWWPEPGFYSVKVEADPEKAVAEINEYDNSKETGVNVYDFAALALEKIQSPAGGYEINATIYCEGASPEWANVSLFINGAFYSSQLAYLQPKNNTTVTFLWNPPSGSYSLKVKVNPALVYLESNINNNEATLTCDIERIYPDLSITSSNIYISPDPPLAQTETDVIVNIQNLGYANSRDAVVKFFFNDAHFANVSLQPIDSGGQRPVTTKWTAQEGKITVEIDLLGNPDGNLLNNKADFWVERTLKSDLSINSENLTLDPQVPYEGSAVVLCAKIYNLGEAVGEGTVYFYEGGTLIGNASTGLIAPSGYANVFVTWAQAKKGITITVRIIPTRTDNSSGNNEACKTLLEILTPIKPDLAISNIYFDPAVPIYNETCRICVNISNIGNTTSSSAMLGFYDDTTLIKNVTVQPLLFGSYKIYSVDWLPKKGATIYVTITGIDDSNVVNNADSVYVSYVARTDIEVVDIRFSNNNPTKDENVYIYADLKNVGDAPSREAIIKFYANNILIEQKQVSPLQPNQTASYYVLWNVTKAGGNVIKAVVEYEDTSSANNLKDVLLEAKYQVAEPSGITKEQTITLGGIVAAIFASIILYSKRYAIFSLFIPLQHKYLTKEKIISTPLRRQILAILEENPGSNAFSLVKMTNKHYNAIDYNLKVLREFQLVKLIDTGYDKKYYLETQYIGLEPTPEIERKIIDTVFSNPQSSPTQIAKKIDPVADENFIQMVRRKTRDLEIRGLLTAQYDGDIPKYSFAYPRSAMK